MRVLVTGAAGFIGSRVAEAFRARGDDVTAADVAFGMPSITDARWLRRSVQAWRPELVCHLAAQVDVRASVADPAADAQVNIVGTVNVLEAAREAGARVILASSAAALLPRSPYGVAKLSAEQYVLLYNQLHGTPHCILRLANVYGPGGRAGVTYGFCTRVLAGQAPVIYGDGKQTRDFVDVSDVVRAFTLTADHAEGGTWNIGTGTGTSVLDLIAVVREATGYPAYPEFAPARPGEIRCGVLEKGPGYAAKELGWHPEVMLADGVRKLCRWIRDGEAA